MTTKISVEVLENLILRIAGFIGPACSQYLSLILGDTDYSLSAVEQEILVGILTNEYYDDGIIENASFITMERGISTVVGFYAIIMEEDFKQ